MTLTQSLYILNEFVDETHLFLEPFVILNYSFTQQHYFSTHIIIVLLDVQIEDPQRAGKNYGNGSVIFYAILN